MAVTIDMKKLGAILLEWFVPGHDRGKTWICEADVLKAVCSNPRKVIINRYMDTARVGKSDYRLNVKIETALSSHGFSTHFTPEENGADAFGNFANDLVDFFAGQGCFVAKNIDELRQPEFILTKIEVIEGMAIIEALSPGKSVMLKTFSSYQKED